MIRSLAAALATTTCIVALATPAAAQTRDYDIPAGPLRAALDSFARQSGRQVIYRDDVRSARSPGVKGARSADEALAAILTGTGFSARQDRSGALAIVKSGNAEAADRTASSGETENSEIIVTGSNIRGIAPVGTKPVVLDRAEIEKRGYSTTEQLLTSLPQNFRGGAAGAIPDTNFSNGTLQGLNVSGGSGVNLRGLGGTATLVLVNGHRIGASGYGTFSDVSTIPVTAIERVEVLADGASAIYGTDAVAGVVNFVLKNDYEGAEVRGRYGIADGLSEYRLSATVGKTWSNGSALLAADYYNRTALTADERSYTSAATAPTVVLPSVSRTSLVFSGYQEILDSLRLDASAQYSLAHNPLFRSGTFGTVRQTSTNPRINGDVSLTFRPFGDFEIVAGVSGTKEKLDTHGTINRPTGELYYVLDGYIRQRMLDFHVKADGSLFDLPGGGVKLAVGAERRLERYSLRQVGLTPAAYDATLPARRNINSVFGEIYVPVFGAGNATPGLQRLELSAALRHDDYSDFGGTTNPKFGISWTPVSGVDLRASYGRSFRAPSIGREVTDRNVGTRSVDIVAFTSPTGSGQVPVALLAGSGDTGPETATNLSLSASFHPAFVPGLKVDLGYYHIRYRNQIVQAPYDTNALVNAGLQAFVTKYPDNAALQAYVAQFLSAGAELRDQTNGVFGSNPLSQAVYVYDERFVNAASTDTWGWDLAVSYGFKIAGGESSVGLDVTRIEKFDTRFSATAPIVETVGGYGYPSPTRARIHASYSRGGLDVNGALNWVEGYADTSGTVKRRVSDYTTVDLSIRYTIDSDSPTTNGLSFGISATNLFNQNPPYISSGIKGSHYDPANADPLGRLIAFDVIKRF